jgi:DNA ligase-1
MHLNDAKNLHQFLTSLKSTSGNSKKEKAAQWKTPAAREFLNLVGDKDRVHYVTWETVRQAKPLNDGIEWDTLWYEAEKRICTPSVTAGRIKYLLTQGWPEDILKAIVEKTLDAGISVKEVFKSQGSLAPFAVALAADWCKMKDKKREKILAEREYFTTPKMDGLRCLFVLIPGQEQVLSRKLKPLKNLGKHLKLLLEWFKDFPCVVDGEILSENNSWEATVNAVKNSNATAQAQFYPFDLIPAAEYLSGEYSMPKHERLNHLSLRMDYDSHLFVPVFFSRVRTTKDVSDGLEADLNDGWEGSVLHDLNAIYRPNPDKAENRSEALVKIKEWQSAEFRVFGFIAGTGKHYGRLGAMMVRGEIDGREIVSEVGTGFTDELRHDIWDNQESWKNALCEIKFFQTTPGGSLRFPSFLRRRVDLE